MNYTKYKWYDSTFHHFCVLLFLSRTGVPRVSELTFRVKSLDCSPMMTTLFLFSYFSPPSPLRPSCFPSSNKVYDFPSSGILNHWLNHCRHCFLFLKFGSSEPPSVTVRIFISSIFLLNRTTFFSLPKLKLLHIEVLWFYSCLSVLIVRLLLQ